MAKRFIETGLLRKPLLRKLKCSYKILFIYYITECDHAGIWSKSDLDIASLLLGETFTNDGIKESFGDSIIDLDDKWFMPSFIEFQYGELKMENRVHHSVIKRLEKVGINTSTLSKIKPLTSPLQGAKDKDKDKDKDKEALPFPSSEFKDAWQSFIDHRKKMKSAMTPHAEKLALSKIKDLSESDAIFVINESIINGWKGLFADKLTQGQNKKPADDPRNHAKLAPQLRHLYE